MLIDNAASSRIYLGGEWRAQIWCDLSVEFNGFIPGSEIWITKAGASWSRDDFFYASERDLRFQDAIFQYNKTSFIPGLIQHKSRLALINTASCGTLNAHK